MLNLNTEINLDEITIKNKINNDEIVYIKATGVISQVWNFFSILQDNFTGKIIFGLSSCNNCKKIFTYKKYYQIIKFINRD